jgi:glucose-6-phosphate 1-epimerase
MLHLHADGASVRVSPSGGHVVSWRPRGGTDALYLSPLTAHPPDAAIRGGIPVVFPQFANLGPLPKHGFARTAQWHPAEAAPGDDLTLALTDTAETRAVWPHAFELALGVALGADRLRVALRVRNTGDAPFSFTAALHTYLRVGDIDRVGVEGLDGVRFRDKTAGGATRTQQGVLWIGNAVDSVYERAPDAVSVVDADAGRRLAVEKRGFEDVVVWNPWREGAAELGDLPDGDWRHMLCVEAAQVARPVTLAPGERWEGTQQLTASAV